MKLILTIDELLIVRLPDPLPDTISVEYPGLSVEPVVGDFEEHLELLPVYPARMIAFMGRKSILSKR